MSVLLYGLVAFVVTSAVERTARAQRDYSPTLTMAGWSVMSFSATLCLLLLVYAAWAMLTGAPPPPTLS